MTRVPPKGELNSAVIPQCKGFQLEWREAVGLALCYWPGRSQTVLKDNKTFYLDGAHTEQSMWACRTWFDHLLAKPSEDENTKRILIFNSTGERKADVLLAPLISMPIDRAIFCTNETKEEDLASDNTNLNFSFEYAIRRVETNKTAWDTMQKTQKIHHVPSHAVPHIEDALKLVDDIANGGKVQVFVTGSLHLVGGVLSFIHPDCYEKSAEEIQHEIQTIDKYSKLSHDSPPVSI